MAELSKKLKIKNISAEVQAIAVQPGQEVIVSAAIYEKKLKDIPAVWQITGVYEQGGIE